MWCGWDGRFKAAAFLNECLKGLEIFISTLDILSEVQTETESTA